MLDCLCLRAQRGAAPDCGWSSDTRCAQEALVAKRRAESDLRAMSKAKDAEVAKRESSVSNAGRRTAAGWRAGECTSSENEMAVS